MSAAFIIGRVIGAVRAFAQSPDGKLFINAVVAGAGRKIVKRLIKDAMGRAKEVELYAVDGDIYEADSLDGSTFYYLVLSGTIYRINEDGTYLERVLKMVSSARGPIDVTVLTDGNQVFIEQA